ncbi:MAG: hypothetical protein NC548_26320 [Lachnospiraceae bacterium]|nr:hypothetical protein [Lachnospiraceae bacterium]
MSKYKKIMSTKGIQQKEVLDAVHRVDPRVDKSLLSKIVNDVCLPTPKQFTVICDTLACGVADIYDPREIALGNVTTDVNSNTAKTRARRENLDVYNLTVEIPRDVAERVFAPDALRKYGCTKKSELIRRIIFKLDANLSQDKKTTADGAGTSSAGNTENT